MLLRITSHMAYGPIYTWCLQILHLVAKEKPPYPFNEETIKSTVVKPKVPSNSS
jgi:hypothetical protein